MSRLLILCQYSATPTAFFGRLQRILVIRLPPATKLNPSNPKLQFETTYILVAIQRCEIETTNLTGMPIYEKMGPTEVVDMVCVQCLIGRVPAGHGIQEFSSNRYMYTTSRVAP